MQRLASVIHLVAPSLINMARVTTASQPLVLIGIRRLGDLMIGPGNIFSIAQKINLWGSVEFLDGINIIPVQFEVRPEICTCFHL